MNKRREDDIEMMDEEQQAKDARALLFWCSIVVAASCIGMCFL